MADSATVRLLLIVGGLSPDHPSTHPRRLEARNGCRSAYVRRWSTRRIFVKFLA
ncbi:hypothetical protein AB0L97_14210 [Nocardia sp. NPDC051911]|uniref:hypothetical protein n=1 Tax=Nocardia sp. NPDC051911 TaxID=3154648 RepID=UPI0034254452